MDELDDFVSWTQGKLELIFAEDLFRDLETVLISVRKGEENPNDIQVLLKVLWKRINSKEEDFLKMEEQKKTESNIELNPTDAEKAAEQQEQTGTIEMKTYQTCEEFIQKSKETFSKLTRELREEFTICSLFQLKRELNEILFWGWAKQWNCMDLDSLMADVLKNVEAVLNYEATREELFTMLNLLNEKLNELHKMLKEIEEDRKQRKQLSEFMANCALKLDSKTFQYLSDEDVANVLNGLAAIVCFIINKKPKD